MKNHFLTGLLIFAGIGLFAQPQTKRVLFLGNSYTASYNLPGLVAQMAASTGDALIHDAHTPGGYTLQLHSTNQTSLTKIARGNWDAVVLQEQSQLPSFPANVVENQVLPFAKKLDSLVHVYSPCAETVFFRTWGRRNGDAQYCSGNPPVCSYAGMDSLLALRYQMMALQNNALLSAVGEVWKYLRQNAPQIELYDADGSHPSYAGSYAAACCFYTVLYRKNPLLIGFNGSMPAAQASAIRAATKTRLFDSLAKWYVGKYDPLADFSITQNTAAGFNFTNNSTQAASFTWYFGDGATSTELNPQYSYTSQGNYTVSLVAMRCGRKDSISKTLHVPPQGMGVAVYAYPNPVNSVINFVKNHPGIISYTMFNQLGQHVSAGKLTEVISRLDVQNLPAGAYTMQLTAGGKKLQVLKILRGGW